VLFQKQCCECSECPVATSLLPFLVQLVGNDKKLGDETTECHPGIVCVLKEYTCHERDVY